MMLRICRLFGFDLHVDLAVVCVAPPWKELTNGKSDYPVASFALGE